MVKRGGGYYKHSIPDIGLSIERYTEIVPADGKFYLIKSGEIIGSYKLKK